MILGPDAVEEVLKHEIPGRRYVHVATHVFFQSTLPSMWESVRQLNQEEIPATSGEAERITGLLPGLLSGLVCAGANLPPETGRDDGLLTSEEVTWLDLTHCDLLVLSACRTAIGEDRSGEGMMSLQRAFQLAGAKSVVASLWNVDDESTVELMRSFYRHLWLDRERRTDALRHAQLEMLAKNRAERRGRGLQWTWGAFVLYGDWR
jgi:CHAT domain-containing protein